MNRTNIAKTLVAAILTALTIQSCEDGPVTSPPQDDGKPSIQFTSTSSSANESVTRVYLELQLSNNSSENATVQYAVDATSIATNGKDFLLANGTSEIRAGGLKTAISLTVVDDTTNESNETVIVTLSNPTNATLGGNTGHTYTIKDNDTAIVKLSFKDDFNKNEVIGEAGSMSESRHPNWWLNIGAYFIKKDGLGSTAVGELSPSDPWFRHYAQLYATDTDTGKHPQNIFRLVTKKKWKNFRQQCYFNIARYILSNSPERRESNGLLLFCHYKDGNNLYYVGPRADGVLVVFKKINGTYVWPYVASTKVFPGTYNRKTNPNLIPQNTWIGVAVEVESFGTNRVHFRVYLDTGNTGNWTLKLEGDDTGGSDGPPHLEAGFAGIRTDFADVFFEDYLIEER